MENPVFKLEKVVHSKEETLQDFEGPLDLILFLLSKNKMEIQDISISLICGQYLDWLHRRQEMDLEIASEFVTMASHLVYLKTRMLLAIEDEEAKSEMDLLIQSLEERKRRECYAKVKLLAQTMGERGEFGRDIVTRLPETTEREKIYEYRQDKTDLLKAIAALRDRAERALPPSEEAFREIVRREPYPVAGKAREIVAYLKAEGPVPFSSLFQWSRSRSEVVATFLAILELCRTKVLFLTDSETDCTVRQERELPENFTL